MNSGGVFNNQQTGMRFLSRVFLAGNYTAHSLLWHYFVDISAVHKTDLIYCSIRILTILSDMVNFILPLIIHRGLNMVDICFYYFG